jgi:hypothetical protein
LTANVVTRWAATAPATGKSTAMDIHHWWRFRDGKICFYRGTKDAARKPNPDQRELIRVQRLRWAARMRRMSLVSWSL